MTTPEFQNIKAVIALEKLKIRVERAERKINEALVQVVKVGTAIATAQAKIKPQEVVDEPGMFTEPTLAGDALATALRRTNETFRNATASE